MYQLKSDSLVSDRIRIIVRKLGYLLPFPPDHHIFQLSYTNFLTQGSYILDVIAHK